MIDIRIEKMINLCKYLRDNRENYNEDYWEGAYWVLFWVSESDEEDLPNQEYRFYPKNDEDMKKLAKELNFNPWDIFNGDKQQ